MKNNSIYKSLEGKEAILKMYEEFLLSLPFKSEQIMIPTRHGQTFCIACGDKTNSPLILLHGSGSNALIWREEISGYSKNFRVYAVDIIGEPGKSEPNRPSHSGNEYAEWLLDIVTYLKIEKGTLNITGISLGGWMAIKFAVFYPEYVNHLALLCAGGISRIKFSALIQGFVMSFLMPLIGEEGIRKGLRKTNDSKPLHPDAEKFIITIFKNFHPRLSLPLFSDAELKRLTMPVLFLGGSLDSFFNTEKSAKRLRALLNNVKIKIFPDKGHILMNMQSEVIPFLTGKE
jgi:pimeloyl-ACP methyl ester carboxylesterase